MEATLTPAVMQGDLLPDITVFEYLDHLHGATPHGPMAWRLPELAHRKKIIAVGILGAFLPNQHTEHLTDFAKMHKLFVKKNIDEIWCITPNDPFVNHAWAHVMKIQKKVRMLSDYDHSLSQALGATIDFSSKGIGVRPCPFSFISENGKLIYCTKEPDIRKIQYTNAQSLFDKL